MVYDTIIIGSGPAGLTAGIYTSRAKLKVLLIEGKQPGGQLTTTTMVENWPGIKEVAGFKLMMDMREHAKNSGCEIVSGVVEKVNFKDHVKKVYTNNGKEFEAKSVIIASGATHKTLGVEGEKQYWSKGVSVCATCDAPFFQDKEIVVVGGGDSAVTESEHLSKFAKKVTIVHILDKLTATDPIKEKVLNNPKIKLIYNSTIKKIDGDGQGVTNVEIENNKTSKSLRLDVQGVFVAIGFKPNTKFLSDQIKLDKYGYIERENETKTSMPGVFTAGDVSDYRYRQAITAAGFGCMAALDCQKYLE